MRRFIFWAILWTGVAAAQAADRTLLAVTFPDGTVIQAEAARTPEEQARGLMFRPALEENRGMLFLLDGARPHPFWMKNTLIALDIIWMDEKKTVIHIEYQTPPCKADPCPTYGPSSPSQYVLEVKAGVARQRGLKPGMILKF